VGAVKPKLKSGLNLNPGYTFKSFVVGKSNRLAHAASAAVAETPGEAYNPLFIWGGVGLGKTHLMHAICHYSLEKRSTLNVVYVSSEKFINEFIHSIQTKQGHEFKNRYRNVDILLIDDIQFMGEKQSSQEEFFHTFDSLREINKQIVICSDRPPTELRNIEDRLVSRFTWGLVTDIQPPDLETRIAILQKKAQIRNCQIPEDVVSFLAQRIPSNIRELEGALNRVIHCSALSNDSVTIDNVSVWLKDILRADVKGPATISAIQGLVAESLEMSVENLMSPKRTAEIALARQIAMYLCGELTEQSQQAISLAFNKKDHTTYIHARKKVAQMLKDGDQKVQGVVDNVRSKL
jgi:chromosomal replication initiator protein